MSDETWHEFEILATDVQPGDKLFDRLSKNDFLWPNFNICSGIVGPFLISSVNMRGKIVELVVKGGNTHLHRRNDLLLVHRLSA